ncbi:MAG TPA: cobalt transporter CbiM [Candidatus Lokiarchaeia archaeon]|nr:cobalt transporter CbiM [Candidatus Lokiarchaeia archaeon]
MHIPDGYLGPITFISLWIVMIPAWAIASSRLKRSLDTKQVPLLAVGAAFSFVIMLFNIPFPGGTTGHAVGGTFIAIMLGPAAALVAESVVLLIQALFFGDGGITTFGANCFNMAFILPCIGYVVYKLITRHAGARSARVWIGAAIGSYVGINAAALCAGIELGSQTILYPAVNGQFTYFMYPVDISVTVMLAGHMLAFGIAEAMITALIVAYLQKNDPALLHLSLATNKRALETSEPSEMPSAMTSKKRLLRRLLLAMIVLLIVAPLGILAVGTAFGEWGSSLLQALLGYVPAGVQGGESLWKAPFVGYGFGNLDPEIGYWISAIIGVILILGLVFIIQKSISKKGKAHRRPHQFVERTLNNVAELVETSFLTDQHASRSGFLQGLDPRVKVVGFLALLVAVNIFQDLRIVIFFYAMTLVIAAFARLPMSFFIKRVWLAIPLFAGIVSAPAILNIFTPGTPVIVLVHFDNTMYFWIFHFDSISITREGILSAVLFIFRVATSISLILILTMTTRWAAILKSLRVFGVPQMFVLTLAMTYQYIQLLVRTIQEMYLAKKARTISYQGPSSSINDAQHWMASRIGVLFRKSYAMIDDVQAAMIARGFHGEIHLLQKLTVHKKDVAWILIIFAIIAIATMLSILW